MLNSPLIKNKYMYIKYFILYIIIISAGIFFRLYPITVTPEIKSDNFSETIVNTALRNRIAQNIANDYGYLPAEQKNRILNKKTKKALRHSGDKLNETAKKISLTNKKRFYPYLLGVDSYHYYELTKRILIKKDYKFNFSGKKIRQPLMLAPYGHKRQIELHPFLGAWLYSLILKINKNICLIPTLSSLPLILFVFIMFFYMISISYFVKNKWILFLSGLSTALLPFFIKRSAYGWYDTDPYNLLFPLIIFFFTLKLTSNFKNLIWPVFIAVFLSIYSFFWYGWLFLLILVLIVLLSDIIQLSLNKKPLQPLYEELILILLLIFLLLTITLGYRPFYTGMTSFFDKIHTYFSPQKTNWPNIFATVEELKQPSLWKIINLLGGPVTFGISLLGFLALTVKYKKSQKSLYITPIIFFIFLIIPALKIERFTLLFITPYAICAAIGINSIYNIINKLNTRIYKSKRYLITYLKNILFLLFILYSLFYAQIAATGQKTLFNYAWENILINIKATTPKNAIIESWWAPGHFIRAIAHRQVILDGATMNVPQAYWIAYAFLSEDEVRARNIFNMLATSGNSVTKTLENTITSQTKAIKIIKDIAAVDQSAAENILRKNALPEERITSILNSIFIKKAPAYLLIYNDLLDDISALIYTKYWNTKMPDITRIYKPIKEIKREDNIVTLENNIIIDLDTYSASRLNKNNEKEYFKSILFVDDNKLIKKDNFTALENNNYSIFLDTDKNSKITGIISSEEIISSIVFQLFYADTKEYGHFEKITEVNSPEIKTRILIYKIK